MTDPMGQSGDDGDTAALRGAVAGRSLTTPPDESTTTSIPPNTLASNPDGDKRFFFDTPSVGTGEAESAAPPQPRLTAGATFGKFVIEKPLGSGGQACVYQAYDKFGVLGHVALKLPHHRPPADRVEAWALREVEPLVRLDHPNILKIKDAGLVDGVPYVATELIDAVPLWTHCATQPPSLATIERWMITLTDAIGAAHQRGVIHRDLKPQNVLIRSDGQPIIIDFGVAWAPHAYVAEQTTGTAGTPAYMAPEQARGDADADHRADLFALGGLLKFMLTGKPPTKRPPPPPPSPPPAPTVSTSSTTAPDHAATACWPASPTGRCSRTRRSANRLRRR